MLLEMYKWRVFDSQVTKDTANSHLEQKAKSLQTEESTKSVSETVEKLPNGGIKKKTVMSSSQQFSSEESFEESWSSTGPPVVTTTVTKQITQWSPSIVLKTVYTHKL